MQTERFATIFIVSARRDEGILETLARWLRNARTRAALATLDARELDDVGLSEGQRRAECAKRFWRD